MEREGRPRLQKPPEAWRKRLLAGAVSGGTTLALLATLIGLHVAGPQIIPASASALLVSLEPKPPGPPDAATSDPGATQAVELPAMPQVAAPLITIATAPTNDTSDLLSDSQLDGAVRAGDGGAGGGRCDTAQAVQQVLRRDPRVRAAVANADRLGKASMLWNGDWVQSGGQDGKGLAVVRQAIIWKVAFAPEACRNERMRGMVLLSLADGRTRFAIGAGEWRWSDLLELRGPAR